jgi:hypothetical protein
MPVPSFMINTNTLIRLINMLALVGYPMQNRIICDNV